jgi:DNA-binding MarR family transcriptional regulator
MGVGMPGLRIGESWARVIVAVGFYEDLGISPTYEDLARATGRSLSRIRSVISEISRKEPRFAEVSKDEEGRKRVKLTAEGKRIYDELIRAVTAREGKPQAPQDAVRKLDRVLYSNTAHYKPLGAYTVVVIDTVVPALKIPEIVKRLKEAEYIGPKYLTGLSSELATAAEQAAHFGLSQGVEYGDLAKTIINVPLRVVRVLEVSLPPHIERAPLPLRSIIEALKSVSLWPMRDRTSLIYRYVAEADALGLVKLSSSPRNVEEVIVSPRLYTGLHVVDRVSEIGFDVIASTPSRAWIPALTIFGDATTGFHSLEELLECRTRLLSIVSDIVGREKCEKWVKHTLNIEAQPGFKMPALARGNRVAKTFGVLEVVEHEGEKKVLSLSVARRIVGDSFKPGRGPMDIFSEAKKKVETIVKQSGFYGELLKKISTETFISTYELVKKVKDLHIKYNVLGTEEATIRELERFGFIQTVADNYYYSAWTITPIHEYVDENARALLVWISREILTDQRKEQREIMTEIVRDLIERGSVDVLNKVSDRRTLILVAKKLGRLEKMQLIRFLDESTVSIASEEARKLLETAYIGSELGLQIPDVDIEERSRDVKLEKVVVEEASKIAKKK